MPRNQRDKGGRQTRTDQQKERHRRSQGLDADSGESVGMQGRDDENRVGGRGRRTTPGRDIDDTAEGGRQPSEVGRTGRGKGRRRS